MVVLFFLLNNETLFQIIQEITQCRRIASFMGKDYRVIPGHGHHLTIPGTTIWLGSV